MTGGPSATDERSARFGAGCGPWRGTVRILELADGTRAVRLEGLDTDNGPDLYLYLSTIPADGEESAFDDDHVNLGRLRGNLGDQNYDLPAGTDLSRHASVVICATGSTLPSVRPISPSPANCH